MNRPDCGPEGDSRLFPEHRIRVVARLEELSRLLEFVRSSTPLGEFPPARVGEIELVLEEALVNIMNYAYPETPGELELRVATLPGGRLRITICDWGVPFNPLGREDPDLDLDLTKRPIGGLGIFFIKQFADEVAWQRRGDENLLELDFEPNH